MGNLRSDAVRLSDDAEDFQPLLLVKPDQYGRPLDTLRVSSLSRFLRFRVCRVSIQATNAGDVEE